MNNRELTRLKKQFDKLGEKGWVTVYRKPYKEYGDSIGAFRIGKKPPDPKNHRREWVNPTFEQYVSVCKKHCFHHSVRSFLIFFKKRTFFEKIMHFFSKTV